MVSSCAQVVGSSALVGSIRKGVQPDEHTFNKLQEHALESTLEAALMLRFNQLKSEKKPSACNELHDVAAVLEIILIIPVVVLFPFSDHYFTW